MHIQPICGWTSSYIKGVGEGFPPCARQAAIFDRDACSQIETMIQKIETALERQFQGHLINTSASPNAVDPVPILHSDADVAGDTAA